MNNKSLEKNIDILLNLLVTIYRWLQQSVPNKILILFLI